MRDDRQGKNGKIVFQYSAEYQNSIFNNFLEGIKEKIIEAPLNGDKRRESKREMHPVMKVEFTRNADGKPLYILTLSRANFNHLSAGCPDVDRLVGTAENGTIFYIFENPLGRISDSFQLVDNAFFACVGAPIPRLPDFPTAEDIDKMSKEATANLE